MSAPDRNIEKIALAAEHIQRLWNGQPAVGMVLGTGSGRIAEQIEVELRLPYADIPNFPQSTAMGHRGSLVCGRLAGRPVIAMQGRFHLYEGYTIDDITLPIHVMQRLGIRQLLVSNAAGGVNPKFEVGDLMLIDSCIDLFFRTSRPIESSSVGEHSRTGFRADSACNPRLIEQIISRSREHGVAVHRGTYVGLLGPTYETRAEYRMCRILGGDAVGMSTIPEIATASRYGIPTLAVSIITNLGLVESNGPTSGHAVIAAAESAVDLLCTIFACATDSLAP